MYTKGEWNAYCLGSEGYQVRYRNPDLPKPSSKEELKERLTPIVERMGGSFETQKANAHLIAASPRMIEFIAGLASKGNAEAVEFLQTLDL